MKKHVSPRAMLVCAMLIFGTIGWFRRNISLSSGELALYRAVMAALLIGGFFLLSGHKPKWSAIKKQLPLLLFSGAAIGINWIMLFEAYRYTTVSIATLSYYFAPVLVMLLCPVLFREKLTGKQVLCFVMSTIGLVMITGIGTGQGQHGKGIAYGLAAAVFYASVILMNKRVENVDGMERTFIQFLTAILVLLPYVLLTEGISLQSLSSTGWVNLLIVGFVHTGIAYCVYFTALKALPGQETAVLSYMDPLVAVLISVTALHEPMNLWQVVGGILILGATIWNEIK